MEIYALIGPSGTGKSHHADEVADRLQIQYIIDDGLLIHRGKRLAGFSAKAEPTMVAAVKRAIFFETSHAEAVRNVLEREKPKRLLILGTSEHMIDRIIGTLQLPPIKESIFIHDVASEDEIETARTMRQEGRHVIPLPAIEVRKDLPTVWIDPIVGLFKRKEKKTEKEKTIIRPTFSNLGQVTISEQVVIQLVHNLASQNELLDQSIKTTVKMTDLGILVRCEIRIRYGTPIQRAIIAFQHQVADEVEFTTGLAVRSVDVHVQGIIPS